MTYCKRVCVGILFYFFISELNLSSLLLWCVRVCLLKWEKKCVFATSMWVTSPWCRVKSNLVPQRNVPLQWHHTETMPLPIGQSPAVPALCLCVCVLLTCWPVYVPSHPLTSPVAECRGWWESEGFLRSLPQGELRAGSREPASATYTDSSARKDDRMFSFSSSKRWAQSHFSQHFFFRLRLKTCYTILSHFFFFFFKCHLNAETKKEREFERAQTDLVDLLYKHLLERKEKVMVLLFWKHNKIYPKQKGNSKIIQLKWFQRINVISGKQEHHLSRKINLNQIDCYWISYLEQQKAIAY